MSSPSIPPLTFAVPKGRILDEALPLMACVGVVPEAAFHDKANRALTFGSEAAEITVAAVRAVAERRESSLFSVPGPV